MDRLNGKATLGAEKNSELETGSPTRLRMGPTIRAGGRVGR